MGHMMSRVLKLSFVVSCIFLALSATPTFCQKQNSIMENKVISLELREKPLNLVAEEIFKQTGCKITFDEKWNALLLSGQYTGVTLEEFFQRALRKQNVTLSYDKKGNFVNLRFLGDRDIGKIKANTLASENASLVQANEDIKVLHEQQRQALQKYLNDPESVDPVSGMKLGDLHELHGAQRTELERLQNDPKTIDPVSGMTNAEIKKLHDVQHVESEHLRNDPNAVDPVSGMTNAEIKKLHEVQHVALEQLKKPSVTEKPEQVKPKE
jgi:YHS domain-containing protein